MLTAWAQIAAAAAGLLAAVALRELVELVEQRDRGGSSDAGLGSDPLLRAARAPLAWPLLGAAVGWLVGGAGVALGAAVVAWFARRAQGAAASRRAARAVEREVPALARSLGDALRGGLSLRSAIVASGSDGALGVPMRRHVAPIATGLERGAALSDALHALGQGGGAALRLLAGTLALHSETGGRLVSELTLLAEHADRASRADDERAGATAQARATVRVVGALPLLALAAAEALGGGLLGAITTSVAATALLGLGLALEVAAVLAARAIVGVAR